MAKLFRQIGILSFVLVLYLSIGVDGTKSKKNRNSRYSFLNFPQLKYDPQVKGVADGNSVFGFNLQRVLNGTEPGNLIFSPFSLSAVMAISKLGARGETAKEIQKGMKFPNEPDQPNSNNVLRRGYSKIFASFENSTTDYILASANKLYLKDGFHFQKKFLKNLKQLEAQGETIDFSNNILAANNINHWVENVTHGKIKDLISPASLNADTRLVLVNGVYFKGFWKQKFLSTLTRKMSFYLTQTDSVQVSMMMQKAEFLNSFIEDMDADAVSLPYQGERLAMILYVPRTRTGLWKIEEGIQKLLPAQILRGMRSDEKVQLFLPKFKIETTLSLVEPLKELGIEKMFSRDEANFKGILKGVPLYVSQIVQKAFIEVNEEGSEAAAATGVIFEARSLPMPSPQIRADRPFLFQIVDTWTKMLLFQGRCTNPTQT